MRNGRKVKKRADSRIPDETGRTLGYLPLFLTIISRNLTVIPAQNHPNPAYSTA